MLAQVNNLLIKDPIRFLCRLKNIFLLCNINIGNSTTLIIAGDRLAQ